MQRHWPSFKPEVLALFAYTILLIMWLKFLVIWRLFRLWALCDGVEPPENMQVRGRHSQTSILDSRHDAAPRSGKITSNL